MCEFVSWIEKDGAILFLTGNDVFNTKWGKELREHCGNDDDLVGHGAIRYYYNLSSDTGINKECTDFTKPSNFPDEIVKAIKNGEMRGFSFPPGLLCKPLNEDYWAKLKALDEDYGAKLKPLNEDYWAKRKALDEDYWAKRKPPDEDYWAKRKPLNEDYWAKRKPLDEDYEAKRKPLDEDYWAKRKALDEAMWDLFTGTKNRTRAWR
jgi:hypothetical protein